MTGLFKSVLSISAATVLSRTTGYLRTLARAFVLGTTLVANAYAAAALLPSLIYELLLGGILYSIFIPVLIERITNHGEDDARRLTDALFTIVLPLMVVTTLAGIIFAGPIVSLATNWTSATDLSPEKAERTLGLAVLFFRIFAVQMLFYGLNTIATGVLQAHRRFFLPTFAPVLNNLIVIVSFFAYYLISAQNQTLAIYVLSGGATFGVAVMAFALVPTMFALGYVPRPRFGHPALASTLRLAGPMVVLVVASVGFQLYGNYLGSGVNAVAALGYAFVIFSLPYGIFAVAIATALLPELSGQYSRGDSEGYRDTFSLGLRTMAFVVVPASVGMITLSEPIVGLLYQHGEFGPRATQQVAALLSAYSVGLLGYSAYFFMVRAFYSRQNTKTPAVLNVAIFVVYAALAYWMSRTLGAPGIALALSAAYAVLTLASLAATRYEIGSVDGRRLLISLARILAAAVAMYAVARFGVDLIGEGTGTAGRALVIVLAGGASLAVYLGAAYLLRAEELKMAVVILRRRRASGTEDLSADQDSS